MHTIHRLESHELLPLTKLIHQTLPERYSPSLFMHLYEHQPEGFYVAKYAQRIVGYLIALESQPGIMRILMVGIDPHFKRRGIATNLFQTFFSNLAVKKIQKIVLEVQTTNHPAIQFYSKMGFSIKETIPSFYQTGADAYLLELWL